MSPAVLFPRFDHPAIEERYASWQSQTLLRAGGADEFALYDIEEPASRLPDCDSRRGKAPARANR